ncbi:hypothetical protein ACHAWU_000719 [Discostella pseudostelligera]|uniref:BTB domain-containing protein n=1 Tax=Discostella pseudostelligera TaxID=259834 RepID=A0ABD3MFT9_9STRA
MNMKISAGTSPTMASSSPPQDGADGRSASTTVSRPPPPKRIIPGGAGASTPEITSKTATTTTTTTTTTTSATALHRSAPPVNTVTPPDLSSPRRASSSASAQVQATLSLFLLPKKYRGYKKKRKEEKKKKQLLTEEANSSGGGSSNSHVDDDIDIALTHDLTRRRRKSLNKFKEVASSTTSTWTSRLIDGKNNSSNNDATVEDHYSPILRAWMEPSKSHLMDVTLEGKDRVSVPASKFLLACFSPVLEEIFYKQGACEHYVADASKLTIGFCTSDVIRAAVHHCFAGGELPPDFDITTPSEDVARKLAQLDHLARVYKLCALGEVTYRALRKLINRRAVLACAIFDELSYRKGNGAIDSIKRYALDTMRDMPMDTLLSGGVQWMKEESVEAIMQDQDMDVDEFYMFKILKAWAAADAGENRFAIAVRLSKHIQLIFIQPALLMSQVKESGYFDDDKIAEAVKLISDSLANRDPSEMERVLVEGAGTEIVNGIYCRVDGELGMGEEEVLFVKEADDGFSDVGLYLWGTRWYIAMCVDFSNCFYSCEDPPDKGPHEFIPARNWVVEHGGADPVPSCTYLPNTRIGRLSNSSTATEKSILAPNLEEMLDPSIAEKRRSSYFDKTINDVAEKRTLTLEQMMNLPQDRGSMIGLKCEQERRNNRVKEDT